VGQGGQKCLGKKIAQDVAQPIFVKTTTQQKVARKRGFSRTLQKMLKVNNRPKDKNSPNLVALVLNLNVGVSRFS
jgi:hypothetical protein